MKVMGETIDAKLVRMTLEEYSKFQEYLQQEKVKEDYPFLFEKMSQMMDSEIKKTQQEIENFKNTMEEWNMFKEGGAPNLNITQDSTLDEVKAHMRYFCPGLEDKEISDKLAKHYRESHITTVGDYVWFVDEKS